MFKQIQVQELLIIFLVLKEDIAIISVCLVS